MPMRAAAVAYSQPVCLVVDRLVCKISKISTSKPGVSAVHRQVAPTYDLVPWAFADSDCQFCITKAKGDCQQLADAFLASPDLNSWLDRKMNFFKALVPILEDLAAGAPAVLPSVVGTFTFRSPGQGPSPYRFRATVTLIDDGGQRDQD